MPLLSTKTARDDLKKRREPYWMRLHKGCYLGFRRGPDTWIARWTTRNKQNRFAYQYQALDAHNYDAAKDAAEKWFARMGSPLARVVVRGSVRDALATYIEFLREQGRDATADNAEDRFRLIVWDDLIANIKLEDLSRRDFREWRERLRDGRKNRSVNRHIRSMIAGLNRAVKEGHSGNPDAWQVDPLSDDAEQAGETTLFLRPSQRDAIIKAASPACAQFLHAIEHTGGRPGELAAATVADLDVKSATITLRHKKGRPAKLRPRAVVLSDAALAFFRKLRKGKTPAAPLLVDPDRKPWGRHKWADEVQLAIRAVNKRTKGKKKIPAGASAYSFRHARISELLQTYGVDPITVAQQTGTSTRMIELNYFKFIAPALREKLSASENAR